MCPSSALAPGRTPPGHRPVIMRCPPGSMPLLRFCAGCPARRLLPPILFYDRASENPSPTKWCVPVRWPDIAGARQTMTAPAARPGRSASARSLRCSLQSGQVVLDVACGTGLSLPLLRAAVGESGRVYGFDHSPADAGTRFCPGRRPPAGATSDLIESAAQTLVLPEAIDALLFHYTHDILRSPAAIDRLLGAGTAREPWWRLPGSSIFGAGWRRSTPGSISRTAATTAARANWLRPGIVSRHV
jgi:SAM-dependent methyltransferase